VYYKETIELFFMPEDHIMTEIICKEYTGAAVRKKKSKDSPHCVEDIGMD
jgi:hypothetical protein